MGFGDVMKKISKLGQDTKNGVQKMSDSVSISNRITQEKKSLERLFASIGEVVYKENPDQPKAGLEDEWAAVKVAYANIEHYTDQLNHVKGIIYCPNCGKQAANSDKFCARCGFKLEGRPETTGAKMAQDIKEAGQEVGKMAGEAADRTGEMVGGAAASTHNAFSWLKGKMPFSKKSSESETETAEAETAEAVQSAAAMSSEAETAEAVQSAAAMSSEAEAAEAVQSAAQKTADAESGASAMSSDAESGAWQSAMPETADAESGASAMSSEAESASWQSAMPEAAEEESGAAQSTMPESDTEAAAAPEEDTAAPFYGSVYEEKNESVEAPSGSETEVTE